ncbi:MAG: hypothetical protein ACTS2F_17325 [Thainema sp.]
MFSYLIVFGFFAVVAWAHQLFLNQLLPDSYPTSDSTQHHQTIKE